MQKADNTVEGNRGYAVIETAISQTLTQHAVEELLKSPETERREKYTEYEIPDICLEIRDEFIKNADQNALSQLLHPKPVPAEPLDMFVGVFRETKPEPTKLKTARKGDVYVTIALTDLSPDNGWYTFYEGSHTRTTPLSELAAISMKAGDAMVWRDDLVYFQSAKGGGMFVTLVYW